MPVPTPGVAKKALSTVLTGTLAAMSAVLMLVFSRFHAAVVFIRPAPWRLMGTRSKSGFDSTRTWLDDRMAWRNCAGFHCRLVCLAALMSSAAAPVACGEAMLVPLNSE